MPDCTGTSAAGPTLPLCMAFCSSAAPNGVQISILTHNIIPYRGVVPSTPDRRVRIRAGHERAVRADSGSDVVLTTTSP